MGATSNGAKVLIVEEYVPEYRRRFLEMLDDALAPKSISLRVAVGTPGPAAELEDKEPALPIVRAVPARSVSIAGRRLTFRRLSALAVDTDLIIVDQGLRHLENYLLLLRQRRGRPRVALWGHGKRLVAPSTRLERLVERRMTTSGHWFFAYTQRGADHVAATGFPRDRITIVQNTFDISDLARQRNEISEDDRQQVRSELGLPQQNVCLYIGALVASKRIDFLMEACSIVAKRIPDFTLVVAGDGPERHVVEGSLAFHPWLRYVGRALGREKARLGAVSDALLMPGRVGLVAIDSFALQTPIITTRWDYHSAEIDYLEDGFNAQFSGNSVSEFAETIEQTLRGRDALASLKAACASAIAKYSLSNMVTNFAGGVEAALQAPRR